MLDLQAIVARRPTIPTLTNSRNSNVQKEAYTLLNTKLAFPKERMMDLQENLPHHLKKGAAGYVYKIVILLRQDSNLIGIR